MLRACGPRTRKTLLHGSPLLTLRCTRRDSSEHSLAKGPRRSAPALVSIKITSARDSSTRSTRAARLAFRPASTDRAIQHPPQLPPSPPPVLSPTTQYHR